MEINNRRELKAAAGRSLADAAYNPKKLILIHTGASLALALLATVLDFVLSDQIADTGGLGGLGLRSVLSTVQSVLRIVNMAVLPFWELGFTYAALQLAKGNNAQPGSLLEGFRRWGPALRTLLLETLIYAGIGIICINIASYIFMLTPMSGAVYEVLTPYLDSAQTTMDAATAEAVMAASIPMIVIFVILYLLVCIPVFYQLRMIDYALLDDPAAGAFAAMRKSRRLMRGNKISLFRLDLSFWWFYAAQMILNVICYADILLPMLGVELPFSETVSFFACYILSMGLQMVFYLWRKDTVAVTYAHAYETLRQPEKTEVSNIPKQQPWNYQ